MKQRKALLYLAIILFISPPCYSQEALRDLVQAALLRNDNVQNASLDVEQSKVQQHQVRSTFIPKLTASTTYAYGKLGVKDFDLSVDIPASLVAMGAGLAPVMGLPENPIPSRYETTINHEVNDLNIFTAGLSAQWVLFTGTRAYHLDKSLQYKQEAQRQMIRKAESEVIKETVGLYDRLALLHQSERLLEESARRLAQEQKRAKKAFESGLASKYDYQKIEIATLTLESKKIELAGNKALVIRRLEQLTGEYIDDLSGMALSPWVNYGAELGNENRPEIQALTLGIEARKEKLKSANSGYLPKVAAMGTYQYMDLDLAKVDPMAFVGIGATWNLFDGFHTKHEKQLTRIEIQKAQNELEAARDLTIMALDKAETSVQVKNAQLSLSEQSLNNARLAYDIRSGEYKNGMVSVNDFLEAETDLQNAVLDHMKAIFDQRQAALALLEASGALTIDAF